MRSELDEFRDVVHGSTLSRGEIRRKLLFSMSLVVSGVVLNLDLCLCGYIHS
ncbi:hypothetical protein [Sulfuracidifex tepidarius]|uniref:hypothetical protein n=1 Tax=Sulfuracidifex tepidarius TaxID=1294262 RepID=UPI000A5983CE|nr:hypothetical protein [Sulfuracidifex tepidarius]